MTKLINFLDTVHKACIIKDASRTTCCESIFADSAGMICQRKEVIAQYDRETPLQERENFHDGNMREREEGESREKRRDTVSIMHSRRRKKLDG